LQEYVVFSGSVDDIMGCTYYEECWFNLVAVRLHGTDSMSMGSWVFPVKVNKSFFASLVR
jgi:hypothetical protein